MLTDKYEEIIADYKQYVENNSKYGAKVVKYNSNTSAYFPITTCPPPKETDTDACTIDKIEYYNAIYFSINHYAKDKTIGNKKIASQVIINELIKLTQQYFGGKMNMKMTLNEPTPNLDTSILRQTMQFQGYIGNARANIIRR